MFILQIWDTGVHKKFKKSFRGNYINIFCTYSIFPMHVLCILYNLKN